MGEDPAVPRIAIAVPSYQYVDYVRQCLDSIANQDFHDFEVLIADGGSTDGSLAIIEEFCARDSRFRLVSRGDHGQADAVNSCFKQTRSPLLYFLNADDVLLSRSAFTRAVAYFDEFPEAGLVTFGGWYLDIAGKWIRQIRYRIHPLDSFDNMRRRTAVIQPATFFRREVWEKHHFRTDRPFSFDSVFFWRAYIDFNWVVDETGICGYRIHQLNKSVGVKPARVAEIIGFEKEKFGGVHYRILFLYIVLLWLRIITVIPVIGRPLGRFTYLAVNSLAFATAYRLPGI